MRLIYDLIYMLYALFYLPATWLKGKRIRGLAQRLGFYLPELIQSRNNKRTIWLHAVSVGEVLSVAPLLESLRKEFPQYKLVVSVTTSAGFLLAEKIVSRQDLLTYFPFDLSWVVKKAVTVFNPALFISLEKEFWPNLINRMDKNKIPMVVVNGRMSEKSLAKYKLVKFLFKGILNKIVLFCMQTPADTFRMVELGVGAKKVTVTGNLKFDAVTQVTVNQEQKEHYFNRLGLNKNRLLVAGSTHRGEEEIIVKIYQELALKDKGWILLLAPRHLERVEEVEQAAKEFGLNPVKISKTTEINGQTGVYILAVMGELKTFYALADLVFVGGSLIPFGGHNLIEPAYFKKAIIFGRHIFNFQDIAEGLIAAGAAMRVKDSQDLKSKISSLTGDEQKRASLGQQARKVVTDNLGATQKSLGEIKKIFK